MTNFLKSNLWNRRNVLVSIVTYFAFGLPSHAMSVVQAEQLVNKVIDEINKIIASGKRDTAILREFEKLFEKYADMQRISKFVLGKDARKVNDRELARFTSAFKIYISHKYGKRFREFLGGKIHITSSARRKKYFEVNAEVQLRKQKPFDVKFLVSDAAGKPLFFTMIIEGIDLILLERSEIGSLLDRNKGDIGDLIKDLENLIG